MRLFRACDCVIGEQQQSVLQAAFGKHSKDRSVVLQFGMKKHVAFVDKPVLCSLHPSFQTHRCLTAQKAAVGIQQALILNDFGAISAY